MHISLPPPLIDRLRFIKEHPLIFGRGFLVWLLIAGFSIAYISIGYFNQIHLRNGIDLGTYTQILWNINEGNVLPYNTIKDQVAWGDHAHFIMALLAPLFSLAPSPITVSVLQVLAVTTSGWAIYALAQKLVRYTPFALVATVAYLGFFGVQYALDFDFHPNVLTAAVFAWSVYAFHFKRWPLYWLLLPIGLATREDAATLYAAFGVYVFLMYRRKYWKIALITFGVSALYFFFVAYVLMPKWNPGGTPLAYFDIPAESRNPLYIAWWIIRDPKMIWENMTDTSIARRTMRFLFQSHGFLPLLSPGTYLLAAPNFVARFLSPEEQRHVMHFHYSASLASVLAYGAIISTAYLASWGKRLGQWARPATLVVATLALASGAYTSSWRDIELPLRQLTTPELFAGRYRNPPGHDILKGIGLFIAPEDSVAANGSLLPAFAARKEIYILEGDREADWIILTTLYDSWPLSREESLDRIRALREDSRYNRFTDFAGIHVFERINEN